MSKNSKLKPVLIMSPMMFDAEPFDLKSSKIKDCRVFVADPMAYSRIKK